MSISNLVKNSRSFKTKFLWSHGRALFLNHQHFLTCPPVKKYLTNRRLCRTVRYDLYSHVQLHFAECQQRGLHREKF